MRPGPKTILCIDDEFEILNLRRKLLEMHGFNVLTAESGRDGLRLLSESPTVDLILLDFVMPQMGGEEVARELKRLHPAVPIILVSGHPKLSEAFLSLMDGHVKKGEEPELLIGVINRVLLLRN